MTLCCRYMHWRWRRMGQEGRLQVWPLYGWFTGLMMCGSFVGAVAWGLQMESGVYLFISLSLNSKLASMAAASAAAASSYRLRAASQLLAFIEFFCVSAAKLLVLHRMIDFTVAKSQGLPRRWSLAARVVMAAVVLGNTVGICSCAVAAVYFEAEADFFSEAAAAFAANKSTSGTQFQKLAFVDNGLAYDASSVALFAEVTVLLLIISAFACAGLLCARRVNTALSLGLLPSTAESAGRRLRLQIVCTVGIVFLTFLLRAAFATISAVASALQNDGKDCKGVCSDACFNMYSHITVWLRYTPELQFSIVFISSPLALLVALWGMTSVRALQLMGIGAHRKPALLPQALLNGGLGAAAP